jgi:methylenetetrahydrofolate dehydrogenase (NADP+)/methenyltetrahydrofolate cyclohydrolase
MLIDGRKISSEIKVELKEEIEKLKNEKGRIPGLATIIIGKDKASQIYVGSKVKTCSEIGIQSFLYELAEDIEEKEVLKLIEELNIRSEVDAILVQLPLPKQISEKKIMNTIIPSKDVDCFSNENIGRMFLNPNTDIRPCTPAGILELLSRYSVKLEGKKVVILGRSNIVGKPIAIMLISSGATVTVCNSKTVDLEKIIKKADILISAIGKSKFIKKEMIKENAIIIDVGINRVDGKITGDVDFDDVIDKVSMITPVPGGVGPMTIAMLLKNTVNMYRRN